MKRASSLAFLYSVPIAILAALSGWAEQSFVFLCWRAPYTTRFAKRCHLT
jgi:hypothetical protein